MCFLESFPVTVRPLVTPLVNGGTIIEKPPQHNTQTFPRILCTRQQHMWNEIHWYKYNDVEKIVRPIKFYKMMHLRLVDLSAFLLFFPLFCLLASSFRDLISLIKSKNTWKNAKDIQFLAILTLPMLRLLSSITQDSKDFWKTSKPCHVGTHWKALADEYPYARVSVIFHVFLHHFVSAKLATSSIRVRVSPLSC